MKTNHAMENLTKAIYALVFIGWISIGGYLGCAGYTKLKIDELNNLGKTSGQGKSVSLGNITFQNAFFMEAYQEEIKAIKYFPQFFLSIPNILVFLITACSFGILGAQTFLVKIVAIDSELLINLKVISVPLLGALTGIIVLGLATTVPVLLISGESELKPVTLIFLCFFGGFYNAKFFNWLNDTIGNMFPSKKP